ncbi:hypothetical protein ACHAQJ_004220 [Trichoderma viride]
MDRQEIDRVLNLKRLSQGKACYPCRERKVKCDHSQPCQTCQKRGHPEICTYALDKNKCKHAAHGSQGHETRRRGCPQFDQSRPKSPSANLSSQNDDGQGPNGESFIQSVGDKTRTEASSVNHTNGSSISPDVQQTYEGNNSILGLLRQHTDDSPPVAIRESGVSLGLQNTFDSDPFAKATTQQQRHASLLSIAPKADEIQRYSTHPFVPLLVDIDQFELLVCKYLESWAAGELQDASTTSSQWFTAEGINSVALLLATLSCAAHFSALDFAKRADASLDFVRRAFQALRLANYMLRPSLDAVQALLLVGNTLQNIGQSDGSWVLLGTTVRLAQALGLHTASTSPRRGGFGQKGELLWSVIIWQDCFLSVCHGRPTGISKTLLQHIDLNDAPSSGLSYFDIMRRVGCLCLELTEGPLETERAVQIIEAVDECYSHAMPYLRDRDSCRNLQERLEFLALQVNMSFSISVLCRPAMRKPASSRSTGPHHELLARRAKDSLLGTLRAFLAFQALSIMPLRNWSMIHSALTSMLLLSIWDETRDNSEARELREQLVGLLLAVSEQDATAKGTNGQPSYNTQWLSPRSIRTLLALQAAIRNMPSTTRQAASTMLVETQDTRPWEGAPIPQTNSCAFPSQLSDQISALLGQSVDESHQLAWLATDLSPFTYLDEIIDIPGSTQFNAFL